MSLGKEEKLQLPIICMLGKSILFVNHLLIWFLLILIWGSS